MTLSEVLSWHCLILFVLFDGSHYLIVSSAESDQKFDRKKSFFGRHIPVLDRKHHTKGTAVHAAEPPAATSSPSGGKFGHQPHHQGHHQGHQPDRSIQGNGVSNEWDGRGVSPIAESSMRESRSVGNLDGTPPPRRRPGPPSRQMSYGFQLESGVVDASPRIEQQDKHYQSYGRDRDRDRDREYSDYDRLVYDDLHKDRSFAELTPDSGISTTSDSERLRGGGGRPSFHKQRSLGKRQYSLQDEDYYGRHRDPHPHYQDDYLRDRDMDRYYDDDSELYSNPSYVDSTHFDEEEEEEVRKRQQQKQKKKKTVDPQNQSKSDIPPGHYRSIQGSFQKGYRIKYLPKTDSVEEETKEDVTDGDGVLVGKKKQVLALTSTNSKC